MSCKFCRDYEPVESEATSSDGSMRLYKNIEGHIKCEVTTVYEQWGEAWMGSTREENYAEFVFNYCPICGEKI